MATNVITAYRHDWRIAGVDRGTIALPAFTDVRLSAGGKPPVTITKNTISHRAYRH
jgi:hypothetical protein